MLNKKLLRYQSVLLTLAFLLMTLVWVPGSMAADEEAGKKPLNYTSTYLTEINNNASSTGEVVEGNEKVPVHPTFKIVFDKNIVSDSVWTNNQKCFSLLNKNNSSIPLTVSRISDQVNFEERRHVFLTPVNDLAYSENYRITVHQDLTAKNGVKLNQDITIAFTTMAEPVVATQVNIESGDRLIIPEKLPLTEQLHATVYDQKGQVMQNQNITWSLMDPPNGVNLDNNGLITVQPNAVPGAITVRAALTGGIYGEKQIMLEAPAIPGEDNPGDNPAAPGDSSPDNPVIPGDNDDLNDNPAIPGNDDNSDDSDNPVIPGDENTGGQDSPGEEAVPVPSNPGNSDGSDTSEAYNNLFQKLVDSVCQQVTICLQSICHQYGFDQNQCAIPDLQDRISGLLEHWFGPRK